MQAQADEEVAEYFLTEQEPPVEVIKAGIRRAVVKREFAPVFMGSALKNTGIQSLLDGIVDYLPSPNEVKCVAFDLTDKEKKEIPVETNDVTKPFIGMAFKIDKNQFGQLTYFRTYQGWRARRL